MKKRLLSWLMVLTLCLTLLPTAAFAAEDAPEQTQPVSEERQENAPAGEQETPAPGEEQPAPEEEQEDPASEEGGEEQPASETKQPAAAPAAENGIAPLAAENGIATYSGDHVHYLCGGSTCNELGGHSEDKKTTFIEWTDALAQEQYGYDSYTAKNCLPKTAGNYYLAQNVTLSGGWRPEDGTVLCLNGKTVTIASNIIVEGEYGANFDDPTGYYGKAVVTNFTLCDCKGGGKITRAAESANNRIVGVNSGTFNMYGGELNNGYIPSGGDGIDSTGGGVLVYSKVNSYTIDEGERKLSPIPGTFNMYGGSITNGTAIFGGGVGIYVSESYGYYDAVSFNMYGGEISGNMAAGRYEQGGGVYMYGGTFNMSGGSIANNRVSTAGCTGAGGGVYVNGGTFNMTGGSISGGESYNIIKDGGGVYVNSGTFNMSGGTICGNTASNSGGGMYVAENGTFTVSGNANISGNKVGATSAAATEANNVYLASGKTITVGGELGEKARIGVDASSGTAIAALAEGVELTEDAAAKTAAKFVSDTDSSRGTLDGTSVKLASVPHSHYLCGEATCTDTNNHKGYFGSDTELWTDPAGNLWAGNTVLDVTTDSSTKYYVLAAGSSGTGSYYLGNDLDLKYPLYITKGTVDLCLNGRELKLAPDDSTAYDVITVQNRNTVFNLTDCKSSGTVTHAIGEKGSGVYVKSGTSFNLFNGSITGNTTTGSGAGVYASGTFYMYGGSITGNTAKDVGGGVYVSGGTFSMSGNASVSDNTAGIGGGVSMNGGSLTMSGNAKITGNTTNGSSGSGGGVYMTSGGTFTMSDNAAITGNTTALYGGGVDVDGGTFTMSGGSITGNNVTGSEGLGRGGGGVDVYDGGKFIMSGGSITGNNVTGSGAVGCGGGVEVLGTGSMTVSGNAQITGNCRNGTKNADGAYVKGTSGSASNLYLGYNQGYKTVTIDSTLSADARIGVTTSLTPTAGSPVKFATGAPTGADYTGFFTPDDPENRGYTITRDDTGNLYLSTHTHDWEYALSTTVTANDTITGTCKDANCTNKNGGSVTIVAPDKSTLTYDGTGKPATLTGSFVNGITPTISYSYKVNNNPASLSPGEVPISANTYTASITVGGVTASVTYTIAKATPKESDFTFSAGNLIYDGTAKTATVASTKSGMGDITVKYYQGETEVQDTTNAGTYIVKITVAEGTNYKAAETALTSGNWTFAIAPRPVTVTVDAVSRVYGEENPTFTAQVTGGSLADGQSIADLRLSLYSVSAGRAAVGLYNVEGLSNNKNYHVTVDGVGKLSVTARPVTVSGITAANKEYDGTTTATATGAAVINGKVDGDGLSVNPGTAAFADKNVGTGKTVTFSGYALSGADASNYTLSDQPASVTANITAKDVTVTSGINATDRSYVKDNKTVDLTKGTLTFTGLVSGETLDVNIPATGTISDAKVGTYNVTYSGVTLIDGTGEAGNYKLVSPLPTVTVNITKATYVGTKNANGSAKYGASGTVDLSSLIAEGGTAAYKSVADTDSVLNGTPAMSADGKTLNFAFADNAANAAKTADIVVEVTSANYLPYEITVTVTVNDKTTPVVTAPTAIASLEYNGSEQVLITAGSTTGGTTMQYSLTSGGGYSTDIPTATNAGTYTVYYKVVGNDDYADVPEAYISVTIAKKAVTVAPKAFTITKGSAIPTFELVYTGLVSGESLTPSVTPTFTCYETGTTPVSASTAAGTYNITWTNKDSTNFGTTNYDVTKVATGTLTINNPTSTGGGSSGPRIIKTETTTNPDGSTTKTETWSDGMVTEATTNPDGSTTKTTTKKDGSSVTESKDATGTTGTVKTDKNGKTEAETKVSEKAVEDAKKSGEAVKVPTEVKAGENSNSAPTVKVELPKNAGETKIEIPVSDANSGTIAVIVHPDGTEEIVKDSVPTKDGVQLTVDGSATIKIIDNSKDFIDTRGHWSRDEVNFVASREIFNGVGNNLFGVGQPMTRGMVNTVLARLAGVDTTPKNGQKWYEVGTEWAKSNGITDGTNPEASVTREQLATLLYRFCGTPEVNGSLQFNDAHEVSDYARSALLWATQNGILNGVGSERIAPGADAQRAQVAAMMARYLKNVG